MIAAVAYIISMIVLLAWPSSVYLFHLLRGRPFSTGDVISIGMFLLAAAVLSLGIAVWQMKSGIRALENLQQT
jgi:hypothetical protein